MSQAHGLILDSSYLVPSVAPPAMAERRFPFRTVAFLVLAAMAAFAPSLAVTWVADLREPSPAACARGTSEGVEGLAAAAAARRAVTEAVVAGEAPGGGRC